MNFRRNYIGTNSNNPDYILSIGSNADKNLLTDALTFSNNGNIEIHGDLKLG